MKRRAQPWLGTLVDITINDIDDDVRLDQSFADAFAAIAEIHRLMSFHDPMSDISRINRASVGESVQVAKEIIDVLSAALMLNTVSEGIFNVGIASRLIDYELLPPTYQPMPYYVGKDTGLIIEDGTKVRKTRPVLIDVGGIAKGYAVDRAIDVLQRAGVQSACINAGGDLRVIGLMPFTISIRDPATVTGVAQDLTITNVAMASSAAYFSRRQHANQLVNALIDGRTGNAVADNLSVSVIAPNCMIADALTKVIIATQDSHHPLLDRFEAQAFIIEESIC